MSLRRVLCPQLPKPHRPSLLAESEASHASRVLRLRDGDTVEAIDGQGHAAPAILRLRGGPPRLEHAAAAQRTDEAGVLPRASAPGAVVPLTLEIAVIKGDAMEWVVEKAVELGARSLVPLLTDHTVVQVKGKGPEAFRERWSKIADQALKQCGRLEKLRVEPPVTLDQRLKEHPSAAQAPIFFCDEAAPSGSAPDLLDALRAAPKASEIRLLVGPEGGWSAHERQMLSACASPVTLGPLILRAETAAIYGMSLAAATFRASSP